VDPRPYAVGSIAEAFKKYPHVGSLLPAIGYGDAQIADLEATIRKTPFDVCVIGTPVDLRHLVKFDKPAVRVTYDLEERTEPGLEGVLSPFWTK
jgi:predicted GTPase